jgi:uncharacterized protein (DUF1778 family)
MKNARLSLQCSVEDKLRIHRAAQLLNQSASEFLRNAAILEAFSISKNANSFKLSAEQSRHFRELGSKAFSPNGKLSRALEQFSKVIK